MKRLISFFIILTTLLLSSCLQDSLDDLTPISNTIIDTSNITYNNSVKAILTQECISCHGSINPSGGLDISTYTKTINNIGSIINRIDLQTGQSGIMPTSGRMSEIKINTMKAWQSQGLPE